jgi:hypothetical protein
MQNKTTILMLVILLCGFWLTQAQDQYVLKYSPGVTGDETTDLSTNPIIEVTTGYVFDPVQAGQLTFDIHSIDPATATGYDFQTNNAAQELWMDPNNPNFLHAIFTNSQLTTPNPDRTCLYYGSVDAGVNWFQLGQVPINLDPIGGQDGRSGYAVIYGTSDGAAVIVNHNNSNNGGSDFRSKIYIDSEPFGYNFTEYDPLQVPYEPNSPIWARMVVDGSDNVILISSQSTTGGAADSSFTNVLNNSSGLFNGWQVYDGHQAEAYAISISESGAKVGMVYEGQDISNVEHDIFYRESTDGGLTWSTPLLVWDTQGSNPDSMMGTWRGIDIEFLGEEPCAVFEIGVVATGESYYPGLPSSIYFWSPNINGGVPMAIADSSNVPFYTNHRGNSDGAFVMGKPSIGRSQEHGYLFVAFAATSGEIWTQTIDSTAYYAGHFMYSSDGGETWTDPEVFTPSGPPVMDWRYPSIVPVSPVSATDNDLITIHMTMQGDTIPGSNFGATGTTMPMAVSAQYYHYTTQITVVGADDDPVIVNEFKLEQNYPNPFNPGTLIKYSITERSNVTLKVYDVLGNEIAVLVNKSQGAGSYSFNFDASNLASGLYIYTLNTGNFTSSKKMMLLK